MWIRLAYVVVSGRSRYVDLKLNDTTSSYRYHTGRPEGTIEVNFTGWNRVFQSDRYFELKIERRVITEPWYNMVRTVPIIWYSGECMCLELVISLQASPCGCVK
jgi:hypothetical protein